MNPLNKLPVICDQWSAFTTVKLILSIILLFTVHWELITPAFAQPSVISVTPSIKQIDLANEAASYLIVYKNNSQSYLEIHLRSEDFKELEEGWKISFLNPSDSNTYRYSLSSWIHFDTTTLSLAPNESREVTVSIDQNKLASGGHYASVIADITEIDPKNDQKEVELKTSLASLLFVRAHTGQEIDQAEVTDIALQSDWWQFPKSFSIKIKNSGNTYLTPYGVIDIYDPFSNKVGKAIINQDSSIVLPETIRKFDMLTLQTAPFLWPGIYTASLRAHWNNSGQEITQQITFLSIGNLTPVVIGILFIGMFLLRLSKRGHKH